MAIIGVVGLGNMGSMIATIVAKETANNETTKSTIDILIKKLNPS